ncbi:hypothetical protein H5T56_02040 [Candidatus Bipolaricaulota bacterium]|nr:hypothetical protein [Candidatus Bipolaricaulota bacterium]
MRKLVFGVTLAGLLALGGFGQVLGARVGGYIGRENLVLLWLNALELSPAQIKALLSLVDELMPLREEIVTMPEKLHEDLLAFTGTQKELRELLASYQKELREKLQTLEDEFISGLKKILTVAQWERLRAGVVGERKPQVLERLRFRAFPQDQRAFPQVPALRIDLLRGMTLVRFLPDLKEALTAKLAAIGN